ncbi:MAG TPA: hypothetical protein VGI57_01970 [Usitatibacter sp.]
MRRMHWIGKVFIGVLLGAAVLLGVSYLVMWLWNWLVPPVIGWKTIDFLQAMGLLVLTRLLVGFRGFGGWHGHHRGHWRDRMKERWANMTPEEREKFRDGMRGRCGHHRHHHGDDESTSSTTGPV